MQYSDERDFKLHHIGLACRDLRVELDLHLKLGFTIEGDKFHDPIQKINGIFITNSGTRIELIEPASTESPLENILSRGIKMYHQCFECKNLDKSIELLKSYGGIVASPPSPAVAFDKRRIAFLMMKTKMLVELIEANQLCEGF
ncbi:VOC family protein [Cohnella xylanilytica]|uniref:VOC family protein n=1 Tax=Cohnella xylanilytica TaxID=557555 RepID=A0A841U2L8_9BACL|nr:VOC family protein [Cohnella xylanilytica]MBB6692214.1 VOC family protein [Cohnella xylanilytica]